jgi:SAM-dependent methyltransferase
LAQIPASSTTIASYDRSATAFADRNASYWPERGLALFAARVPSGSQVLDAGCGPGRDAGYLAERGYRPTAYDLSRGMLAEGRRRGLALPATQGDLRYLPFVDGAFGGAWANASLLHLPRADFLPTLRELARVVQAGCLFLTLKIGDGEAWREGLGGQRFFTYHQPTAVHAALEDAGFRIAESWSNPPGPDGFPWLNVIAEVGRP